MRIGSLAKFGQALVTVTVILVGVVTILVIREAQESDRATHEEVDIEMREILDIERGLCDALRLGVSSAAGSEAKTRFAKALLGANTRSKSPAELDRLKDLGTLAASAFAGDAEPEVALEALDRLHQWRESERGRLALASDRRLQAGIAQVAVTCGGCVLLLFVVGGWITRNVSRPLRRLKESVEAMADGRTFRRAPEGPSAGAFGEITQAINRLADNYQRTDEDPGTGLVLARAALAGILEEREGPAGVVDKRGRLLAGNNAMRTLMRGDAVSGPQLLGRDPCPLLKSREATEIIDGGLLRGYLVTRCVLGTAAGD